MPDEVRNGGKQAMERLGQQPSLLHWLSIWFGARKTLLAPTTKAGLNSLLHGVKPNSSIFPTDEY